MKNDIFIPECLRTAHVTIIQKKNCRLDLKNWRGIFVCSVLRTMLMKLIYERIYEKVDKVDARKNKSVRNHLLIVNSILSDIMSSVNKDQVDLSIMDFKQMFDSEELSICLNALHDAEVRDDMLALMHSCK